MFGAKNCDFSEKTGKKYLKKEGKMDAKRGKKRGKYWVNFDISTLRTIFTHEKNI